MDLSIGILYRDWRGGNKNKRSVPAKSTLVISPLKTTGPNIYIFDDKANCLFSTKNEKFMMAVSKVMYSSAKQHDYFDSDFTISKVNSRMFIKSAIDGRQLSFYMKLW